MKNYLKINEEKPACILLHGMAQSSEALLPIKNIFEQMQHTCFLPQLLGHRHTIPRDYEINFHNWELELDTYIRYVTNDFSKKIIISGHSFGAMLALYLSLNYQAHIKGLILFSPSCVLKNKYSDLLISLLKFIPNQIIKKLPNINKSKVTKIHLGSEDHYSLNLLKHLSILRSKLNNNLYKIKAPIFIIQSINDYHLSPYSSIKIKEYAYDTEVKIALRNLGEYHNLAMIPEINGLVEEGLKFICQEK